MTPLVSVDQLVCHLIGDFFLQSDWMAANKYSKKHVALIHAATYTVPFLAVTQSVLALVVIWLSHAIIDHYKVAPIVAWLKNFLAPPGQNFSWETCRATGTTRIDPFGLRSGS